MWLGVTNDEAINSSFPSPLTSDDEDAGGIGGQLGLFALQLSALAFISALGTFANGLVFAVFYRRPSLRTISNRFVLSLILANLTSAAVMVPGHIYQLIARPRQPQPYFEFSALVQQLPDETDATAVPTAGLPSLSCSWCWHKQGLDGLTVLVALASVLSILLISLDRYYAVNSPLHYSIIVTRQKSMAMIGLVWIVAAILSTPVWAGSVVLQQYAAPYSDETSANLTGAPLPVLLADGEQQQYLMNLCYSVSLILFGFVWPLVALCWLYLRMYEAALKNSARTRRQSLCSNTNANATGEGGISAVAMAAAAAAAAAASNAEVPLDAAPSYPMTHHNSLADALSSTATAPATESHTSGRLLAAAAAAAAAAASSGQQRRRGNRYTLRLNEIQQHIFSILWREEGRALRTTAMVISSFTCCWLPFFVWLLPFQTSAAPSRYEARIVVAASTGVFLARLAAFSNVLISPAIYVYRNKVAQREAGRVLWLVFCPLSKRHRRQHGPGQSNRYSHDIATPLVMGGLGVSGLTTPQLHGQGTESRRRANSSVLGSSRRSSQLTNNSVTDSPTRHASEDHTAVGSKALASAAAAAGLAQNTLVNWRSGSIDCRLVAERTSAASLFQQQDDDPASSATTPLVTPAQQAGRRLLSKPRASIAGGSCRPASSALASSDVNRPPEARQRSHTFSEARLSASLSGSRLSPSHQLPDAICRPETLATFAISSHAPAAHDKAHAKRNKSPNSAAGAAAVAAAAIAAAELKAISHPLAYPSLDFFDTGLEDYGRRGASSSFSRFIQSAAQVSQPNHHHSSSGCAPMAPPGVPGRRRRTCSFSKVLSRSTKQSGNNRWQTVFGSSKDAVKKTATSMPSVQHVPSLVTAV